MTTKKLSITCLSIITVHTESIKRQSQKKYSTQHANTWVDRH